MGIEFFVGAVVALCLGGYGLQHLDAFGQEEFESPLHWLGCIVSGFLCLGGLPNKFPLRSL